MNIEENWRVHKISVKDKLKYILMNDDTEKDVVITVGRGSSEAKLTAHSLILFIGSEVFQNMLEENAKINNDGLKEIKLPDVNPAAMRFVLKHIYFDFINLEHEDGIDLLFAALKFNLQDLVKICVCKLQSEIAVGNVLRLYEESNKMAVDELIEFSKDYITKNAVKTFEQPQFLQISNENLCKLLQLDLQIDEISLFKAVMCWGKAECQRSELEENEENLRFALKNIVPLIRFTIMAIQDFSSVVFPTNILEDKELIGIYHYLSMKISYNETNVDPPAWIFSSSERIINKAENIKSGVSLQPETAMNTKEKLLNYLKDISGQKIILGLTSANVYDNINDRVETVCQFFGLKPGIISVLMPSCQDGVTQWNLFSDEIISKWKDVYLLKIMWNFKRNLLSTWKTSKQANEKKLKGSTKDTGNKTSKNSKEATFDDLIKDGGNFNKAWKNHLDVTALYLHKLQAAGVVAISDILPSMNNDASEFLDSLFGSAPPGPNGSIKLYQMTIDYLVQHHGLHSLVWAWSVDMTADKLPENFNAFWPGEDYVDVVSVYIQNQDQESQFNLDYPYTELFSIGGDKPISMDDAQLSHVSSKPVLLAAQLGYTWMTKNIIDNAYAPHFQSDNYQTCEVENVGYSNIETAFQNKSLIHQENNEFFQPNKS